MDNRKVTQPSSAECLEPEIIISQVFDLPEKYKSLSSYKKIWKVTVIPRNLNVSVIAASNMRIGNIGLENLGKIGNTWNYYVFGENGVQSFRTILLNDRSKYVDKSITFQ
jgi:hypothetical protein